MHSFRINRECLETLQQEAENQGTTTNALANKIFQSYCQHGKWEDQFKPVKMGRSLLAQLIACCPIEQIIKIAQITGSTETKDVFRTIGVNPSYEIVLNFIKNNLGKYDNWFDFNHHTRGNKDIIHLRHQLGYKWSVFIANEVAAIIQTILKKETKIEVFDNCATIEVTL